MIERVTKEYGSVGTVINNAYPRNQNYGRSFFEVEYEDFCENVSLHLGGYFLVAQQMASYFEKQQHGNIINIASIYGATAPRFEIYSGTKMTTPVEYAAIKSAIIHLTKYMAKYGKIIPDVDQFNVDKDNFINLIKSFHRIKSNEVITLNS